MKRLINLLTMAAVIAGSAAAQSTLSVLDVARKIVTSDPEVMRSDMSARAALNEYQSTLAGALPDITLDVTPYSLSSVRVPTGSTSQDLVNHSVGAALSVTQYLPTSGVLSAEAGNTLTIGRGDAQTIEQVPSVSLTYAQPFLVNGRFIDTSVYRGTRRNAELGYLFADENSRIQRNARVRAALGLFTQAATLRRTLDVLETTTSVLTRQIDDAQISRQQGLITDNTLLALRITLNARREALLNTQLALVQVQQELARALGEDRFDTGTILDDQLPDPAVETQADPESLRENNPQLVLSGYALEQAQLLGLFNELTDRPQFSVVVTAEPVYPDSRSNENDFAASLSDYFADGAGVQAVVALNLSIPLSGSKERGYRESSDDLGVRRSEIQMEDTLRLVRNQLQTLLLTRSILRERQELLVFDVAYEEERVANETTLLQAGASTQLKVDEVELDLLSRRNEQWQIHAELFLNTLDILTILGVDIAEYLAEIY